MRKKEKQMSILCIHQITEWQYNNFTNVMLEVLNRPGVAEAVLKSPQSLIKSLADSFID